MDILLIKQMVKNWIFIISLLLIGCFSESSGNFDDLIPRDSFKSILIDIEKKQKLFQLEPSISQINTSDSVFLESILMDQFQIFTGLDALEASDFNMIHGKNVGLVINHTSVNRFGINIMEIIKKFPEVNIKKIY